MDDNERYQQADHYYAVKAVQALGQSIMESESAEGCLATGMLLVHHDIVSETPETEVCWTCHMRILDVLPEQYAFDSSEPALFMRYQLILARTAHSVNRAQGNWPESDKPTDNSFDYIDPEAQRICGVLGLSSQLLFIIESITTLVAEGPFTRKEYKMSCARSLENQLSNLQQWTTEVTGKALETVIRIAESYRLAAQIYLQCRFFGCVPASSASVDP